MATVSLRSATGAATKSYFQGTSTTEWVNVVQDAQGNWGLGNAAPVSVSDATVVDYRGGGTGWQCDCDDSVEYIDNGGNRFWGGLPATRKRR